MINVIPLEYRVISRGFRSAGVRSGTSLNLDPFLNIDLFHMSEPTFPPHPHAGFSAVTYILPESPGSFVNRDSLGDRSRIGPGSIHWTQAGSGMMHEEVPEKPGTDCWGFQIFVNMQDKALPPRAFHVDASEIPVVTTNLTNVRVLAGAYGNQHSRLLQLATAVTMLDIEIPPGESFELETVAGHKSYAFAIDGAAKLGNSAAVKGVALIDFGSSSRIHVQAAENSAWRALIFSGSPIRQPVVWSGPFAMASVDQVRDAQYRYQQGLMGRLAASFPA